jgi:hypothetical protein
MTRMIMDQEQIPTPPQEYAPQWLEQEPEPARFQPRPQFKERSMFDNKLLVGIAIGVIVMGVLMTMRPMVIHGK